MHKKHILVYVWVTILLAVVSLSCSIQTKNTTSNLPSPTVDLSLLSNYILGEWSSVDVKSNNSVTIDLQYRITFQSSSRVKFTVIYPAGDTEGYTSTYSFLDENSIYVDNIRITGGEIWLLEAKDDKLIVTRNFDNKSTTIVLKRTE
jgi:hypothetical protein